ncbi:lysophospholipid acyltransferase family protein [Lampropedia aestuarii]|uniref:Lysophospholipid acyltransferase family protein n=1 Tax=Lampropedia aestuarii TaxID=2562762 RepID=A0A4S5BVE2_9BURK|nr:lysophospholipid acyltransferase family protein [Lampropedia aestuarii]MDH5857417.1 lysophospholipid acyltransferase family protein [Lampropedia aestuarii]THJ35313.1 lysophospholipid acyltransferase family protein [Lampropedia aestuarii]
MFLILRFFSVFPSALLQALGGLLGWLVFLLSPTYRKRFINNAKQAGFTFAQVRPAIGHAGRMVAELPKVWCGPAVHVDMDQATRELLDRASQSQQGVLFITPHMGCFELASQTVAQYWGDARGPLTVLYRPARQPALAKMLKSVRNRNGQEAVPTDMSGVRAMLKSLRNGGSVGMLPDQVPPWGMGEWAPFFGKPAYTMTIAARMIAQTKPQVIMARCERKAIGQGYQLYLQVLELDPTAGQRELIHLINHAVEEQIRTCPEQYMWGYGRYKVPRGMPQNYPHPKSLADLESS